MLGQVSSCYAWLSQVISVYKSGLVLSGLAKIVQVMLEEVRSG
jgi:hypothetical protein